MALTEGCGLALSLMEDAPPAVDVAAIVHAYSTLLFRVAHSVLRSRTEAEDVVQDVFIRLLEHRRSLSTVRDMRVWLIRIAWNLALDRKRRKRSEQLDGSFAQSLASATMPADAAMAEAQRYQSVLVYDLNSPIVVTIPVPPLQSRIEIVVAQHAVGVPVQRPV